MKPGPPMTLGNTREQGTPTSSATTKAKGSRHMADLAKLIAWCKDERAFLKQQLDMLELGQMSTFETGELRRASRYDCRNGSTHYNSDN